MREARKWPESLIQKTIRTWQPYSREKITKVQAIEILNALEDLQDFFGIEFSEFVEHDPDGFAKDRDRR